MRRSKTSICWISSARYTHPLDAMAARKWQLMAELSDYDIRIVGFSASLRPRRFTEHARFTLLPQPPTAPLRYLSIFLLAPLLATYLTLRYRSEILVAQSPFEGAIGAVVKGFVRLFGRRPRLIIENHNNFEEDLFLQRRIPLQSLYRRLMLAAARFAFRHADVLRVISSSTAARARHYAPGSPQIRFMTFSDTDVFQRTERRIPVEAASDIVYAGVLIPRKGLYHLLNAFASLERPLSQLRLVGHAENADYATTLRQLAQTLGISDRVHFHGAVSQRELAEFFAAARVMVLPSLSEGLGRVVVEAMLLGTPVIGSRVGGIPDMIEPGVTGWLVEPGDEAELAAALREAFQADVKTMGAKARAFAGEFFSPRSYVAGYQELFELALRGAGESSQAAANKLNP